MDALNCTLSIAHILENNEASCYLLLTDTERCMQYISPMLQDKWRRWAQYLSRIDK